MTGLQQQRTVWWWLPAFVAAAFLLFWPVLHFTPFSDDHSALWNAGVRGIPWRNGFFRPVSDATFRLGYLLWGATVEGHRAVNVLLHGLNTFLLFILFRQWNGKRGAFFAALLFLVYPYHQESIVWLVGRESALGTMSILVGLTIAGTTAPMILRAALMAVALFLGTLCYESALLLLPMALVIAWSRLIPHWPSLRSLVVPLGLAVLALAALRTSEIGHSTGGYLIALLPQEFSTLLLRIPKAMARLFLPPESVPATQLVRGAGLLVALLLCVALIRRTRAFDPIRPRLVLIVLLLIIATSIAVIGGVSTHTSESDRFLYLPSAFLCGMVAMVVNFIAHRAIRLGVRVALVLLCLWGVRANHSNWREASQTTAHCMAELPTIPTHGRLWISGLPDSFHGAFIFRNGFPEAVHLAGHAGERVVVIPDSMDAQRVFNDGLLFRGHYRRFAVQDKAYHWSGGTFEPIRIPPDRFSNIDHTGRHASGANPH